VVASWLVHLLVDLLSEVFNIGGGVLNGAEFSVKGNVVAGLLDAGINAGLVQEHGEGQDGSGLQLLLALDCRGLDELVVLFPEFGSWVLDVQSEGHDELSRLLAGDLSVLDEFHEDSDWGVGSSDGQGIVEEVELGLVFQNIVIGSARAGLAAGEVLVNVQNFLVVQQPEGLSSNDDLGQSL
jgi:hypothetical protein